MAFHRDPKHNTRVNKKYSQSIIGVNTILPRILEIFELCMSGHVFRIFFRSSLAQIMKAFMGLLMWGLPSRSRLGCRMTLFPYPFAFSSSFCLASICWLWPNLDDDEVGFWGENEENGCWGWWWVLTGLGNRPAAFLIKSRSGSWGKGLLGRFCRNPGWLRLGGKPKGGCIKCLGVEDMGVEEIRSGSLDL